MRWDICSTNRPSPAHSRNQSDERIRKGFRFTLKALKPSQIEESTGSLASGGGGFSGMSFATCHGKWHADTSCQTPVASSPAGQPPWVQMSHILLVAPSVGKVQNSSKFQVQSLRLRGEWLHPWSVRHPSGIERVHLTYPAEMTTSEPTQEAIKRHKRAVEWRWGQPCKFLQWYRYEGFVLDSL